MQKQIVTSLIRLIPKGTVSTYGRIAEYAGLRNARQVGQFLSVNEDRHLPAHRVLHSNGELAPQGTFTAPPQSERLAQEGVVVHNNRVKLKEFLWQPSYILLLYFELLQKYGWPGAWPWFDYYGEPHTRDEIVIGTILTQHTNWRNVARALENLHLAGLNSLSAIAEISDIEEFQALIRPAGFFRQKSLRLVELSRYVIQKYTSLSNFMVSKPLPELRSELLALKGIGPESADVMLLFAGDHATFVIDTYTQRFARHYNISDDLSYTNLQKSFENDLPPDVTVFQNYHALIIRWGLDNKPNAAL